MCGQRFLRAGNDAWHPWTVENPCPPEDDDNGVTVARFGSFGRPGIENFRSADEV